ncbi:hypothetical protein PV387_03365 [Streptomyces sp. ME02-6987-2C]|uniref:hypothetical protein n=1 Tax=unclassified Streptomyces TaxID=2593676 RepID=UPI0029ACEF65|nr:MULTISPECIES: hypothetical protein [unclassified Streptomyces]MDX3345878.1 hypothetical protein [Streptomyces sp. ME02-6979A]MDX3365073.1 hypothetical protein [Streptomyces sp. ME02-6987-2C]MDX3404872.1 hypothetical protein [Streptomyces sp. ME02-6977A]MDX3421644.1 hypothetical protein [Streptomyces sp. ME02-6985-2c]
MAALDLVVPVREKAVNQELRYALRSWSAHLPHRRVWIIGYKPAWLAGVRHVPTRQTGTKYANTTAAMWLACEHPEISDPFLYANDDMFVMELVDEMPVLHRGPLRDVEAYYSARASGQYLRGMRETRDLLARHGHRDPLSYELHVPLPVSKAGMLRALDAGRDLAVLHKRTAFGVLDEIGGERIADVKVLHRGPRFDRSTPFLSTMPDAFANGEVGRVIRGQFTRPSNYELWMR